MATYAPVIQSLSRFVQTSRLEKFDRVAKLRTKSVRLVFENLSDNQNAAAAIRTAESYSIQHIHTIEKWNKFIPNIEITKGADKWISIHHHPTVFDCIGKLKSEGYQIYGADLESSVPINELPFPTTLEEKKAARMAFVFGNEGSGISRAMKKSVDRRFRLPMYGFTQSFNVSVSIGVCLTYLSIFGQLQPNLTPEEVDLLKVEWLIASLGQKVAINILKQEGLYDLVPDL